MEKNIFGFHSKTATVKTIKMNYDTPLIVCESEYFNMQTQNYK